MSARLRTNQTGFLGTPTERFWRKVRKTDGCWLWTGATMRGGYGRFDKWTATRFSYELAYGPIPSTGLSVCHRCDVPGCVRPEHLFLGTQRDNLLDASRKGRLRRESCMRGHSLTLENRVYDGRCRVCAQDKEKRRSPRRRSRVRKTRRHL